MEVIQGIYKIENTKNHKVYIGQSKDIYKRWAKHKAMLEKGNHHSVKLQRSYNKAKDKSIFEYSIVEEVADETKLTNREQYYIDKYNSLFDGYNCTNADSSLLYKAKNIKQAYYYNLFSEIYLPDTVHFGKRWLSRMTEKKKMHYSWVKMRLICVILKWFYDNYDIDNGYTMDVLAWHDNTYNAKILKDNTVVERYHFESDKTKRIYRPSVDMTGFYRGAPPSECEIKLSYEDCLKKWKPIDQLRFDERTFNENNK